MNRTFRVIILFIVAITMLFSSCRKEKTNVHDNNLPDSQIVIFYENDVHCAVDGYAKLAAQRNAELSTTKYVTTASAGDFSSGGLVSLVSQGEFIVDIMNEVGYDVVAMGNHELDYGMEQMFNNAEKLEAKALCANLKNVQTNEHPLPAYHIINYGDIDVAYIGFTTTTSGTVVSLSDESGNPLYSFMRDEFYQNAQYFIDEARAEGAEYVIALTHLGDTEKLGGHPSSVNLIENTNGLDAVIDAHDHHVIDQRYVMNKDGKSVLLTSSGTSFNYVGRVSINTDGTITSSLIDISSDNVPVDAEVQQFVDDIKEEVEQVGNEKVGYSEVYLSVYDEEGNYAIRSDETNLGNFCTDAFRNVTDADVAFMNGGGFRDEINIGDVSYNDLFYIFPFANTIVKATMTGQQIIDALEFSVSAYPENSGDYLQLSGIKMDVNPAIPSPMVYDMQNDLYSHVGEGERRVSNVQILDAETDTYMPIDLNRTYTIASIDYMITERGCSGILRHAQLLDDNFGIDVETLVIYIEAMLGGVIGSEYAGTDGRINYIR